MKKPSKEDLFRGAVDKFAASQKTDEDVNDIIVAGWAAMQMGEGLGFEQVRQILKEVLGVSSTGRASDSDSEG